MTGETQQQWCGTLFDVQCATQLSRISPPTTDTLIIKETHESKGSFLLVPIEDQLRFFRDLPDSNRAIPPAGCNTTLPAETVQSRDHILMSKPEKEETGENLLWTACIRALVLT